MGERVGFAGTRAGNEEKGRAVLYGLSTMLHGRALLEIKPSKVVVPR